VLLPPAAELLGEVVELRVHVRRADDALAQDALVQPAGDGPDPRDVMDAVEHRPFS
jgi:hypothetical protein